MGDRTSDHRSAAPRVDVVVGVHTPERPVERAVGSALRSAAPVRVTVVAHNTDPSGVRARLGGLADDPRVRLLALADGVRSPANSFNAGLEAATAEFVSIIGSDDEFAAGALEGWLALADDSRADVVIAPVLRDDGGMGTAPRPRPGRMRSLDGDRDRLFERAAPLGLIRRRRFADLRFTPGLPRGEDQAYTLELWFSGARVAFDPTLPAYLEHGDQRDRVTMSPGSAGDDFLFLNAMEQSPVFRRMAPASRRAVAAKLLRVHVIGAIASRAPKGIDATDRAALGEAIERIRGWAGGVEGILARRDRAALRAFRAGDDRELEALLGRRSEWRSASALVPANPLLIAHRHAPLRSMIAQRRVARLMAFARSR
ncbi:glycosyltransferase family 2 protein [Agromyces aurantiacus]|uniref:Glycosyltransferase family 2 protein n=1 Tax=Agromyces aurantiacus TaxID=165814 RepID=A0ABV9R872_9MICO|nr:glycosyltransferase [Agromyces aurantiacus]MBM7504161.1 hypothetical protein [Agromyces aurantiacus]